MAEPRTGAFSYVQYGKESTFGTEASTINSSFGHEVTINIERRNNLIQIRGLNDRNVKKIIEGNFDGMATVEGILGNTHWIATAFGSASSSGSGPYTHTYSEADTLPSITIENGIDLDTTDSVVKLLGCKLDEVTLSGAVGEPIRFRAVFFYKTETEDTTIDANPASDSEEPFTFAQASVELPDGTTLDRVQRLEFALRNNLIKAYTSGSRFLSKIVAGARDYTLSFDKTFEDSAMLEDFYGSATGPASSTTEQTADINITNGLSGTNLRKLQVTLTGFKLDPFTNPQSPNELIIENISGIARTGQAIGTDNTSTTIFD